LLNKADAHGLVSTGSVLRQDLLRRTNDARDVLDQLSSLLEQPVAAAPSIATLFAELQQLQDEFDGLQIDWKAKTIGVTTEPITLKDVKLGAFAIQFRWERLLSHRDILCFDIVALNPNPASANDLVTHPHVKDQTLCAGEAAAPLRKALQQGRLADAFSLIRSVLTTYNDASPYVHLNEWGGRECHDCGSFASDDGLYSCAQCGEDFCDHCTSLCSACDACCCDGCLERCAVCNKRCCSDCLHSSAHSTRDCCPSCLRPCASCGRVVARDELAPEINLCPACRPQPPVGGPASSSSVPEPTCSSVEKVHAESVMPL